MDERLLKILEEINEDILSYEGENMLAEAIIDSFEIVEIVARIEDEFDINIDAGLVIAENFKNKYTIMKMVKEILE